MDRACGDFVRFSGIILLYLGFGVINAAGLNERLAPAQDHPAIWYGSPRVRDPVGLLDDRLRRGLAQLEFEGPQGYLRSVLRALNVPVESQVAVFSTKPKLMESIACLLILLLAQIATGWIVARTHRAAAIPIVVVLSLG